ncbi:MAG: LptA/OstA family protein [Hyphomonadaceae bacterium]|nr:LptA/OstA family protein [Hyphomonadaceae bacterium]
MRQRALCLAAGVFAVALALSAPAHAQLSEGGGPVSYSADNLEYFDAERRLVLTGDVDIVQNDARLRADRLTLFFSGSGAPAAPAPDASAEAAAPSSAPAGLGSGDIERMIAEGEVYYVRPQQSARGNRAVYDVNNDSVTFTGNVVVASSDNIIRGETMVLQIGTRRTTIRPPGGGRVRGVFVPSNSQNRSGGSNQSGQ